MITTSSLVTYQTKKIKSTLNTQIKELLPIGTYDYLPTPVFKVIYPNGGEIIYKDSTITTTWYTFASPSMTKASLYYTFNDTDYYFIAEVDNSETSSYDWLVSSDLDSKMPNTSSFIYKFIVSGTYDGKEIIDTSASTFSIQTRSLMIVDSPVKGVVFNKGNVLPIQWQSTGLSGYVDIDAEYDVTTNIFNPQPSTMLSPIIRNYKNPDTETYDWNIDSSTFIDSSKLPLYIKIVVSDSNNKSLLAKSNTIEITDQLITTIDGYKISFPVLQTIEAQGIYQYREYAIETIDDIGEAYIPRSVIEVSKVSPNQVGYKYIKPKPNFIRNNFGFFLGEITPSVS